MQKRKFTVVTQLHDKNNSQIIEYVENSRVTYAHAMRKTFQHIKHADNFNKSAYNTYLQNQYSITKRTANSIISDAQGRWSALIELKRHEKQTEHGRMTIQPSTVGFRSSTLVESMEISTVSQWCLGT